MFKNVAGQKLTVFAFDSTTNLPKTGDAANITAYVSIDDGAVTILADTSATEKDATNARGYYTFDLAQAETAGDKLDFSAKSSTANIVVLGSPATVYTGVQLANVAHGGAAAVITFERMRGISTTLNEPCIHIDGNGTGAGMEIHGGSDGPGLYCWTPSTTQFGVYATSPAGGLWTEATAAGGKGWYSSAEVVGGNGIYSSGQLTGMYMNGSGAGGVGIFASALGSGKAMHLEGGTGLLAKGTNGPGLHAQAVNNFATSHGILFTRGGSAADDISLANSDAPTLAAAWGASIIGNGRTRDYFLQGGTNKITFDVPSAGQFTIYSTDDTTPLNTGTYTTAAGDPVTALDPS